MKKALMLASVPSMIEQFNMNNIKILQEMGYQVEVACNFEDGGTLNIKRVNEFKNELENIGVKFYNIPFSRNPFSLNNIKAYEETKKIVQNNKYEIVHLHSPIGGVCGRLACRKLRKSGTKVIYTAHGFHFYKGAPLINWLIYYPIEKWLSKYTDCLITINSEDFEIANKKMKAKDIKLINGIGVNIEKFNFEMSEQEKNILRESIGIEKDNFVIIYVAELSKRKNQGMLLESIKQIVAKNKNIKIILVGKDSMNGYYQQMAKKLDVDECVKFLGYRKDVPQLMKISNLSISTSLQEGLPVNVMESMICKLPIVVTNCRGNRDLVENQTNGEIVEIGDVNDLKNKIQKYIDNENKEYKYEMEKYTQDYIKKQMEIVYGKR